MNLCQRAVIYERDEEKGEGGKSYDELRHSSVKCIEKLTLNERKITKVESTRQE